MASFCVTLFDTIENPAENDACFVCSTKNLTLSKGSSYKIIYNLYKNSNTNINLSGYSLRGNIRQSLNSTNILLNMTSANLLLQIDNSNIIMNLKESFTRRVAGSSAIYDIELINSTGDATKIITGLITFI